MVQNLEEALEVVYGPYNRARPFIRFGDGDAVVRRPELTRRLLDLAGQPDRGQPVVLVTGSKGKGSVSRLIAALLEEHGLRIGLFTSPHLVEFTERIRVNGKAVSEGRLLRYLNEILPRIEQVQSGLTPEAYLGPVGISLALAMLVFRDEKTDLNVIECGRGGTYDDANVLDHKWAVITPVMDEHLLSLGPTIVQVAEHKAGIIKAGQRAAFSAKQNDPVMEVLQKRASDCGVRLHTAGTGFGARDVSLTRYGTKARVFTRNKDYGAITLPLLGTFQADNASLAIAVAEEICSGNLGTEKVRQALAGVRWPGRCEIMAQRPTVLVDGTINRASAKYLVEIIGGLGLKPVISVVGITAEKDYRGVLAALGPISEVVILTRAPGAQHPFPDDGAEVAGAYCSRVLSTPSLEDAVREAKLMAGPEGLVCVAGTQHIIGQAQKIWGRNLQDLRNL